MKFPTSIDLTSAVSHQRRYLEAHYPGFVEWLSTKYYFASTLSEQLYNYINRPHETSRPTCPVCGKEIKYHKQRKYSLYCSNKCANRSQVKKDKSVGTCLEKYGVTNPSQCTDIKNKIKRANVEKYGVEYPSQLQSTQDGIKATCLEKYGVDNPAKLQSIKDKISSTLRSKPVKDKKQHTCLEKYGVDNPMKNKSIQDKLKTTINTRYGTDYTFQNEQIQNKIKQTNLSKYGVENPFQSPEIQNKSKQAFFNKYGVGNPLQSPGIQNKIKQTNLLRYGVENPGQFHEIQNKIKQTNLLRYGVENPFQSLVIQDKIKQTNLLRYGVENPIQSQVIRDKINTTKRINHTFNTSKIEDMFDTYLNEHNIPHIRQYKSTLYPFCCDFYLSVYDLYIEIQASWTHGGYPYDAERDAEKLKCWQSKHTRYYDTAIETWTQRDVKKRETAKLNNLNYLEIFSNDINECIKQFEHYIYPLKKTS